MLGIAKGEQKSAGAIRTMVGLAAPQIGVPKKVIVVNVNADGSKHQQVKLRAFVNPKILKVSQETEYNREGCYSTGRVCGAVYRPKDIVVEYYDFDGGRHSAEYTGFVARIFQHEIDHLNGIRFPHRITNDNDLHWVETQDFDDYRIHWRDWPNKASRTTWNAVKRPG